MNWKQFKKELLREHKNLCFIDRIKTNRGSNEVRILRFFFCGEFEPFVNFYNAIGFYVIIEKSYFRKEYEVGIEFIEKDTQKGMGYLNRYTFDKAEYCYNEAKNKIREIMQLKCVIREGG